MAETASLTSAHSHVRKATEEFQKVHRSEAAEEHQQASTDFARAARTTNDSEALRVLKLLEQQHQKLAQIIRNQDPTQLEAAEDDAKPPEASPNVGDPSTNAAPSDKVSASTQVRSNPTALVSTRLANQQRGSSPSLAREIASRRGIPQPGRNQQSPAAQARARQLSPESRRRASHDVQLKVPPSIVDSQADLQHAQNAKKAADDEGFAKFYSNLATGTMSKLSSVLAYAGLPLTADDALSEPQPKQRSSKQTVRAGNEPDVKKIFSKAALEALEDEHRQRGTLGRGFGPAESFYVVPPGGGTASYADIARLYQRKLSGFGEDDEEPEFVDAKEVQGQPSPKQSRFSRSQRDSFGNPRTNEELDLENVTLKQTLQELAGRLAAFEAHAQDASFAALTQSMANLRPQQGAADPAMHERLRQLEKQVEDQAEERQKLESLASKQEKAIKKYKSKFDELTKGAKERAKRSSTSKPGEGAGGDVVEPS